jgi:lipopolysaccharide export system protein LptA
MAVIAAFIGYGRFVSHLRKLKLPLPPGVNIEREGAGWTYSRANGSRTLYTIHAAGFQQAKNGKTTLHDVAVVLFGKNGDRHDRLSGQDFEYDEKNGVLQALGVVHIDLLSAAAAKTAGEDGKTSVVEGPEGQESLEPGVIHVTTSRLVYLEKLGLAATSEDVDVQSGQMKGHARGADYSSDSGMLMLHSAVTLDGSSGGHDVHITAGQAQFDQHAQQARLTDATYESQGRSVAADRAVLNRRPDGTVGKVDADGNVRIVAPDGKAVARRAELQMNAAGQPAYAVLNGDVVYTANEPLRQVRAEASDARVSFGASGKMDPKYAIFAGAVQMNERFRVGEGTERWSSRALSAAKVEIWMATEPGGRIQVRNAQADGHARLIATEDAAGVKPNTAVRTELAADELKAVMSRGGTKVSLDEVTGKGHTSVLQVDAAGIQQASTGDTLEAKFRPADAGGAKTAGAVSDMLASAVQQGHVAITRRLPASGKRKTEGLQQASAERAVYDGGKDQLVLSGAVRMNDSNGAIWAQQVVMDRATGDAHAAGTVKVDYVQDGGAAKGSAEPMHIVAERADLDRGNESATFYGNPARVWHGGNQVQAAEIEVDRAAKRLIARGSGKAGWSAGGTAVRTILASGPANTPGGQQQGAAQARCGGSTGGTAQAGGANAAGGSAVRIASGGLVYSGIQDQVEFTGGVRADTADATVRASEATAYLVEQRGTKNATAPSLQGALDHIVAAGEVDLTRAGTHVSGERLVYTAGTRSFLLSGGSHPAKVVDARGTSTAAAFRFTACDDTLEAMGQAPGATTQRVETESVAANGRKEKKAGR